MKLFSTTFLYLAVLSASLISCGAFDIAPKGKKIILTFGGTINSPIFNIPDEDINRGLTNPLKLHILAGGSFDNKRNDVPGQVCLFEQGIATSSSKILNKIRSLLGRIGPQTRSMREKLEEVYEKGDTLYIAGYSRGAAAARIFACELNEKGLRKTNGTPVEIKFLGCFDTVSMQIWKNLVAIMRTTRKKELTRSSVLGETNGKLPDNIGLAVHHVALDDERFAKLIANAPVFMDSKDSRGRVHEAYFPGDHSGVGGNYYKNGISDISCKAMQKWLEKEGVVFIRHENINKESLRIDRPSGDSIYLDAKYMTIDPKFTVSMNDMKFHNMKNPSYRPVVTVTDENKIEGGAVKVHVSVLQHYEAMDKTDTPYAINPEIKKANVIIVDDLQESMEAETKRFKELMGM